MALFQSTGVKFKEGSAVDLIYNGVIFNALKSAIEADQVSINVVLYIWRPGEPSDPIISSIASRTAHGVACRVMVDPIGSTLAFQKEVRPKLLAAHGDVREFSPIKLGNALSESGFLVGTLSIGNIDRK